MGPGTPPGRQSGGVAWVVLGAALVTALVAPVVPSLRSPLIAVSAWASVVLVPPGVGWHRPGANGVRIAVAAMPALWAVGPTLVQVQGRSSAAIAWVTGAGQLVAVGVTLSLVRSGAGGGPRIGWCWSAAGDETPGPRGSTAPRGWR